MAIIFDEKRGMFYLESKNTSYVMKVSQFGFVSNMYYGKKIGRDDVNYLEVLHDRGSEVVVYGAPERKYSPNVMTNEYPSYGKGDYRECAFIPVSKDGSRVFEGKFIGYEILSDNPGIPGMPSLYAGGETLKITLKDEVSGVKVNLFYSVYEQLDVIARRAEIVNEGEGTLVLDRAYSFSVDLPAGNYKVLTQHGAHYREREPEITPVMHGVISVDSKRGATSLHSSCFMALMKDNAGEENGEVCACSAVSLNVCVFCSEKLFCTLNCERFHNVHIFAAAVITLARIPLGIFICERCSHCFYYRI